MVRYYVVPKNEVGERAAIRNQPVDMTGVTIVDLPNSGDFLKIKNKSGKEYPAYKVALAIAAGQITVEDIE